METTEERWYRWDVLINEKKYIQVVKEFDSLFAKRLSALTFGDLIRRDKALKAVGIISFSEEKAKKIEGANLESRRGKH
jgi:hypothetical protein